MLNVIGGSLGGVHANNCGGIVPTGNCNGNPLWIPANGNWWTWGATGVPTTNCANSTAFDFAGGTTSSFTAVTVSTVAVGVNAWQNCNCGAFNCYTNCNCDCVCACSTDSP